MSLHHLSAITTSFYSLQVAIKPFYHHKKDRSCSVSVQHADMRDAVHHIM